MRYSILHRFQGGLIGNALATNLTHTVQSYNFSQVIAEITENLINTGTINLKTSLEDYPSSSAISASFLPFFLFFHDSPILGREKLETLPCLWHNNHEVLETICLWFSVISLALREKLQPGCLVSQLLKSQSQAAITKELEFLGQLSTANLGLPAVVLSLTQEIKSERIPIFLALYCFTQIPEDFSLTLISALRANYQPQITLALTGALAGIYNSYLGVPVFWRRIAQKEKIYQQTYQQSERLFKTWCGIYQTGSDHFAQATAIAAPNVIQAR